MLKNKHISKLLLVLASLCMALFVAAQTPKETIEAYNSYKAGDLSNAKNYIDQAVQTPGGENDALTWHIRGFIYKDLFSGDKTNKSQEVQSSRETAVESLKKSIQLDSKKAYYDNNYKAIKYLATSYYNDAVLIQRELNMNTIDQSLDDYLKYKETIKIIEPNADFSQKDVEFYKALATCNRKIYEVDPDNRMEYLNKALRYYAIVRKIDPNDYGANYNPAVNIYNLGASKIDNMDPETSLDTLISIQASSVKNFENALPFMLKAYQLNPDRIETLKGLRGIYLSLSDNVNAKFYEDRLKELQKKNKTQDNNK